MSPTKGSRRITPERVGVTQAPIVEVPDLVTSVKSIHQKAGDLLASLPPPMVRHLGKVFHSPKPLAIAILASVERDSPESLSMQFKVPVKWVLRLRDSCLRALRQREVELWPPRPPSAP